MVDNLENKRIVFLPAIIFAFFNALIFITPLKLSLLTGQYVSFVYYLILYLTITFSPPLFFLGVFKKQKQSLTFLALLVISSIVFSLLNNGVGMLNDPKPYIAQQVSQDVQLEKTNIKSEQELKSLNFCFKINLPTDLPTTPYQMKFYDAAASVKKCENQLVAITYNPYNMNFIEVPTSYDFNFRKGFEDLAGLKATALSGVKVNLNDKLGYLASIKSTFEGFVNPSSAYDNTKGARLLFIETNDSYIFMRFVPNEVYNEDIYLKIAKSLKAL